ncbi:hypothetical protein Airi02_092700 [Actinoallomurus iriomotensis]|uniref:Uncharacterized protein n=1 Tax=Actinoallomurus iriomotensis TaxID=478107 RepID=A0A9W6W6R2_9ACTN|nr:hypothetical protein Airi02_092700 [Actinoallomurus iriomotensis]
MDAAVIERSTAAMPRVTEGRVWVEIEIDGDKRAGQESCAAGLQICRLSLPRFESWTRHHLIKEPPPAETRVGASPFHDPLFPLDHPRYWHANGTRHAVLGALSAALCRSNLRRRP